MHNIAKVVLSKQSTAIIIKGAKDGYLSSYKEERLGILLGGVQDDTVFVNKAILFGGGIKTRMSVSVNSSSIENRIKHLALKHRLKFLGTFHTHNEVANSISSALSKEDKVPICDNCIPLIEVVATIWLSDSPLRQSKYYCQIRSDDYRIRIAAYRFGGSFPIIPASSKGFK